MRVFMVVPSVRLIPARAGKTCCNSLAESTAAAHPRACGENNIAIWSITRTGGSSPRVRGKRATARSRLCPPRLIPARAGKTWSGSARSSSPRAHPRACGENLPCSTTQAACRGSSPRVRGKPRPLLPRGGRVRLIPARAGKTLRPRPPAAARPAHPRACGENPCLKNARDGVQGSSPRVRGKPGCPLRRRSARGLIPARAGKTEVGTLGRATPTAHPRACGENQPSPD